MLIECLAPGASGKSTITRRLRKHFSSPPTLRDLSNYSTNYLVKDEFATQCGQLKERLEYYEHRRLIKQLQRRLQFHCWAEHSEHTVISSMGVLQCAVDMYLKYDGLPSVNDVRELMIKMPIPEAVIMIHTNMETLVQRHTERSRHSIKELRLGMWISHKQVFEYLTKQEKIINLMYNTCGYLQKSAIHLDNNFPSTKELFKSDEWKRVVKEAEEHTCRPQ